MLKNSTHSGPSQSQRRRNSFRSNHSEFLLSLTRTAVTVSVCGTISRCNLGLGSNSFNAVSCTRLAQSAAHFRVLINTIKAAQMSATIIFDCASPKWASFSKWRKWVLENLHLVRLASANGPQDMRVVRLRCGRIRCKSAKISFSRVLLSLSCSNYD